MTILEEVAFISFLSIYIVWFRYNFLTNIDESQELSKTLQWLQRNCNIQTVNLAFIEHTSILTHVYILHILYFTYFTYITYFIYTVSTTTHP